MAIELKIKTLIEKRLKAGDLPNCIVLRSKKTVEINPLFLKEGREIVNPNDHSVLVRIDEIQVPQIEVKLEKSFDDELSLKADFDLVVVENVRLASTKEAAKEKEKYEEEDWEIIHQEGTENW